MILGVDKSASESDIKKAYECLAWSFKAWLEASSPVFCRPSCQAQHSKKASWSRSLVCVRLHQKFLHDLGSWQECQRERHQEGLRMLGLKLQAQCSAGLLDESRQGRCAKEIQWDQPRKYWKIQQEKNPFFWLTKKTKRRKPKSKGKETKRAEKHSLRRKRRKVRGRRDGKVHNAQSTLRSHHSPADRLWKLCRLKFAKRHLQKMRCKELAQAAVVVSPCRSIWFFQGQRRSCYRIAEMVSAEEEDSFWSYLCMLGTVLGWCTKRETFERFESNWLRSTSQRRLEFRPTVGATDFVSPLDDCRLHWSRQRSSMCWSWQLLNLI